jgi:hypothetical protein
MAHCAATRAAMGMRGAIKTRDGSSWCHQGSYRGRGCPESPHVVMCLPPPRRRCRPARPPTTQNPTLRAAPRCADPHPVDRPLTADSHPVAPTKTADPHPVDPTPTADSHPDERPPTADPHPVAPTKTVDPHPDDPTSSADSRPDDRSQLLAHGTLARGRWMWARTGLRAFMNKGRAARVKDGVEWSWSGAIDSPDVHRSLEPPR